MKRYYVQGEQDHLAQPPAGPELPRPGHGQVTIERQPVSAERPKVGYEWSLLWLNPPGNPPGVPIAATVRGSGGGGDRESILRQAASISAESYLIRAHLVIGGSGEKWVPLPQETQIKKL